MGTYAMTGGASGIGAAIKQTLLDDGHSLIVVDISGADIDADLSGLGQLRHDLLLVRQRGICGMEALLVYLNADLAAWKVSDVAHGGFRHVLIPQEPPDSAGLGRGLYDY